MSDEGTTVREAMKAIAVGDETGIGAAATVGTRDSVAKNADENFKKGVDMFCQDGLTRWVVFVVVVWGDQEISSIHPQPVQNRSTG